MSWTDERVTLLKELWAMGLSASQIAGRLGGFSHCADGGRSAVCGKVDRLGLPTRTPVRRKALTAHRVRNVAARVKPKIGNSAVRALFKADGYVPPAEEIVVPEKERRGVADLKDDQCRWPVGDPLSDDFHFCHHTQVPGQPYCRPHMCKAFETIAMRRAAIAQAKETADA